MTQPSNRMTRKHSNSDLQLNYTDAEQCDKELFAEERSNLLLIAGDHYNRTRSKFNERIRDNRDLSDQQKLRLTKNHTQKIVKTYVNNILSGAPGVGFSPRNEKELQDQKSAELHHSVWRDGMTRYSIEEKIDDWADDFVGVGEVAVKIFWDKSDGPIKAYQQKMAPTGEPVFLDATGEETMDPGADPMTGQPMNQPAPGEPVYQGAFQFEPVYGFNLLRAPEAKTMQSSPYLIIRKMVHKDDLFAKWGQDPEKAKFIQTSQDKTFLVFDASKSGYKKTTDEVLVMEHYFRPCALYPRGYYYIRSEEGVFDEGELPGGIFPLVTQFFDRIQTTPRGRSPVKIMRPYQAEVNRCASKIAEHQLTLGDDKLLIQNGTTVSAGVSLPGVRSINVSGMTPQILPGRDGSQFLAYMQAQISEMYEVLNVREDAVETAAQLDAYALLFRAASQKKKFIRYIKRFERFLINVAKTYLSLCKLYLPDDMVIQAIGRDEAINITEFKNANELAYEVKVDAQSEDVETKLGRQMVLNQTLQYVGAKLDKEDIGRIIRIMPYANGEEAFADLTLNSDSATNDILALDRGKPPKIHEYDDHLYYIKRLSSRMRKADFDLLDPQIQKNYHQAIAMHQQMQVQVEEKIAAAQAGFIPTGGYLVVCDLYVPDTEDPLKTKRVKLPYDALQWLIKNLEAQGKDLQKLETMNQGVLAQMSEMMTSQNNPQAAFNGMGQNAGPMTGAGMPGGVADGRQYGAVS